MTARTLTIGAASYPLVLPNIRDPRLHVASVIITVHVLGQVGLGFRVSIPQILAAILTCWVLEVAITFRTARAFVWPASAMLTGSGVALILRAVGTESGDPWSFDAWWLFAGIAGFSLLTKYVVRYRGSHVFNPSNVGLVVAFIVLGSGVVEPLDFWWAPIWNPWMVLAYAVITIGGLLITRRLRLLGLAASFWLTFAVGLALLSASGHCITANWAFAPVCGVDFWRVVAFSPEVLIFLFFMITDPKTVPTGQVGRVVFGVVVAATCVLLMAPQIDEFGAKVALLSGLVLVCAARPVLERFVPEAGSAGDDIRGWARGLGRSGARVGAALVAVLALGVGVVLAGTPARGIVSANADEALNRLPVAIDPATLPPVRVTDDVVSFDHQLAGDGIAPVVVTLAQNLEIENEALRRRDASLLEAVTHGDRLTEMRARVAAVRAGEPVVLEHYRFDAIEVSLLVPFGEQTGLSLGLHGTGTVVRETLDAAGNVVATASAPFDRVFAVARRTGARWLTVGVLAPDEAP